MATYSSFKRITSDGIADATIATADLASNSVTNGKLSTDSVTQAKLANLSVGASQMAAAVDLSTKTVTYRSVVNADISGSAGIAGSKLGANAATTNLGYTPLDRNNGTMTGVLQVPQGSAASPSIALSGNTNTGIFFNNDSTVRITTNGSERARFDSAGRFLLGPQSSPQNTGSPMFQSFGTGGWLYNNQIGSGTSWQELNSNFGWTGYQRNGNGFSYTNGRYTAPISGFYNFQWLTYHHNDAGRSTNGYFHMSLGRNGNVAPWAGRCPHGIFSHANSSPHCDGVWWSLDLYLNTAEYASVFSNWTGNNSRFHAAHSFFNGYLIA